MQATSKNGRRTRRKIGRDGEVDDAAPDGGDRNDEPGEIHLADQARLTHHGVPRRGDGAGEEVPRDEGGQHEDGVRIPFGGDLREVTEHDGEDRDAPDGPKDNPSHPDGRLLVPDLDVPPGEDPEELAVAPDFPEVEGPPPPGGGDYGLAASEYPGSNFPARHNRAFTCLLHSVRHSPPAAHGLPLLFYQLPFGDVSTNLSKEIGTSAKGDRIRFAEARCERKKAG